MAIDLYSKLVDWMDNENRHHPSLVKLMENLGLKGIIWVILSKKEIHFIEHSDDVNNDFLTTMKLNNDIESVKSWVKRTLNSEIVGNDGSGHTVLFARSDVYNNVNVVISEEIIDSSITIQEYRMITRLALIFINRQDKINSLENALRLGVPELVMDEQLEGRSEITLNKLKPSFVNDVIPHIFYSIVHENYGPYIFESLPDEMKKNHVHIITAVKLFASIDAEMVAEMGHLFTTNPVKSPIIGEIFSLIFTLPSETARGGYEVHSISAIIPSQFYNLSKSLTGELKTSFFMHGEQIRMVHDQKSWSLGVSPLSSHPSIPREITTILEGLRKSLALYFALKLDPQDVINW